MLKIDVYSAKGTKLTPITLPKEWEEKENPRLLAQAIRVYTDRSHIGLRKAQTRAEVNRTTKKLYKQKGTGGARHGSRKAPIFVGGGVALGPRPVKRILTLPEKMKQKALKLALTGAVKEGKVIAGEIDFKKTNEANKFIGKVFEKKGSIVLFVLKKESLKMTKFIRNIKSTKIVNFSNLNALDVFSSSNLIFDKSIFAKEVKAKKETKETKKK